MGRDTTKSPTLRKVGGEKRNKTKQYGVTLQLHLFLLGKHLPLFSMSVFRHLFDLYCSKQSFSCPCYRKLLKQKFDLLSNPNHCQRLDDGGQDGLEPVESSAVCLEGPIHRKLRMHRPSSWHLGPNLSISAYVWNSFGSAGSKVPPFTQHKPW